MRNYAIEIVIGTSFWSLSRGIYRFIAKRSWVELIVVEFNTLQRSFFHAHATEWIIVNVVLLESWCAKVRCIYLLRYLSWMFQQQTYVWKRMFLG